MKITIETQPQHRITVETPDGRVVSVREILVALKTTENLVMDGPLIRSVQATSTNTQEQGHAE